MPNNTKPPNKTKKRIAYQPLDIPVVDQGVDLKKQAKEFAGTATRSVAGSSIPALVRLLSGGVGSTVSGLGDATGLAAVPGMAAGGAISSLGEMAAQKIENPDKPLNWPRVGVEGAIGMVPFGKTASLMKHAVKGGALALGGVIGRKATDEDPNTSALNPSDYHGSDYLQVALGTGIGAAMGRWGGAGAKPTEAVGEHYGPRTPGQFLDELNLKRPEDINAEAARVEALGDRDKAHGLRVTAASAKRGNEATYKAVSARNEADTNQLNKNLNASATAGELPSVEEALARGPKAVEELALRAEALGQHNYASELRKRAVELGTNTSTTARAVTRSNKAAQTTAEKEAQEAAKRTEIERRKAMLGDEVEEVVSPVRNTISATTPEGGRESATITTRAKQIDPEGGEAPTNLPPPKDKYQIVDPNGSIVAEVASPEDALNLVNEAGQKAGLKVVPPAGEATAKLAKKPVVPVVQKPAEGGAAPTDKPFNAPRLVEEPAAPVTPEVKPTAKFLGYQDTGVEGQPPMALYNVEGGEANSSTVSADRLKELGIEVPETPPADAPRPVKPAPRGRIAEAKAKQPQAKPEPQGAIPASIPADVDPEMLARQRIIDPNTGQQTYQPGISKPEGLILQPKEGGGYIRDEFNSEGVKHSETANPKPRGNKYAPEPLDLNAVRADLDNIQDPLVRQMAERELAGNQPTQARSNTAKSTVQPTAPVEQPSTQLSPEQEAFRKQVLAEAENTPIDGLKNDEAHNLANFVKRESGSVNPMLLARLAGGGIGAAAGAAYDKDDRLRGALLGGTAGALAPSLLGKSPESVEGIPTTLPDRLVNWQRFSLLTDPTNLATNTVAPTGGGIMSSLEKIVQGALGDREAGQLGRDGLRALLKPSRVSPSSLAGDWNEAKRLIAEAEQSRADMAGGVKTNFDKVVSLPADIMTTGDISARRALEGAGWSEDASRAATLTNEPRYKLTAALANLSRAGGFGAKLLLPFVKTAANAIEGSVERTPGLGIFFTRATEDAERTLSAMDPEMLARQGSGIAASTLAYYMGKNIDPETAKQWKVPYIITNMGGQFGPLMVAAFTAGQASQTGSTLPQAVAKGGVRFLTDMPLPSTEPISEIMDAGQKIMSGEPVKPDATYPFEKYIPDNFLPRFLKDDSLSMERYKPESRIKYSPLGS